MKDQKPTHVAGVALARLDDLSGQGGVALEAVELDSLGVLLRGTEEEADGLLGDEEIRARVEDHSGVDVVVLVSDVRSSHQHQVQPLVTEPVRVITSVSLHN